ncbi:MAG: cation-transporting P-type ATPase, partial [Proteobacteria bacterium]|nr:cation-transporting P-type ATPase [Pseudomonadota bacterium]
MTQMPNSKLDAWWACSSEEKLKDSRSSIDGLDATEASLRLKAYGRNSIGGQNASNPFALLLRQLSSPIVIIL